MAIKATESKFTYELTGYELATYLIERFGDTPESAIKQANDAAKWDKAFFVRLDENDIEKIKQKTILFFDSLTVVDMTGKNTSS